MPFVTDLADVLRSARVPVTEVAGWKTRGFQGRGLASVQGIVVHHTATPWTGANQSQSYPTLNVVRDGYAGLPGPLAQLGVGRDGTWFVIAAGLANHAGTVLEPRFGNSNSIGIEVEAAGTGDKRDFSNAQMDSLTRGVRALNARYGGFILGHKEICSPKGRKIDPAFDMNAFRNAVKTPTPTTPAPPAPKPAAPAPAPATPAAPTLSRGSTGNAVTLMQRGLNRVFPSYSKLATDGIFGPNTEKVVREFQRRSALQVDGFVGPKTRAELAKHGITF